MTQLYHVDAFTSVPFTGNPAAVCIIQELKTDQWMLQVASEMNLSETAFLFKQPHAYGLRWFTPTKEVTLCGHATLASAHILWEEGFIRASEDIHFSTMSGVLSARKTHASIILDFPARLIQPAENSSKLNQALGIKPIFTGKYTTAKGSIYLFELESEAAIKELKPDFKNLAETEARAVIVTSRSDSNKQDFVSRYFAPAVGIDEDPVTGSAHCCLAPYWSEKLGKTELIGFQASQRGGYVKCKYINDRVLLEGKAVTIYKTELAV